MNSYTTNPLPIGSFASGQVVGVVPAAIVGSFARGQAARVEPAPAPGSFATGQALTAPGTWATGRFCTGQAHHGQHPVPRHVPIVPQRPAEASATD